MNRQDKILDFWFGDLKAESAIPPERSKFWFGGSADVDNEIRVRFSGDILSAAAGEYDSWSANARGSLSLILLLDQFTRNIFRKTPKAFACDEKALSISLDGIQNGFDRELAVFERAFFYLPMEHSEDIEIQKLSVSAFRKLVDDALPAQRSTCESYYDYAVRHYDIIARFNRFPHRNEILGRVSTAEEIEFLKQPGSSF